MREQFNDYPTSGATMEYVIAAIILLIVGFFFLGFVVISFYLFVLGLIGLGLLLTVFGCMGMIGGDTSGILWLLLGLVLTLVGGAIAAFFGKKQERRPR